MFLGRAPAFHDVELSMNLNDFRQSLTATEPPAGFTHALAGLWWDAKSEWTRAHESAQQDEGHDGSWVHTYLHRKEALRATQGTGTVALGSPFAESHWMPNGSMSLQLCCRTSRAQGNLN
jgi:hypothetical protein